MTETTESLLSTEYLAEICMRIAARDKSVIDDLRDLAAALDWGEVRVEGDVVFVDGAVTSALMFGHDPITQATCLNFMIYGAVWALMDRGKALFNRVNDLWHDPGVAAFAPEDAGADTDDPTVPVKRQAPVQMTLFGD
jgi:hypothetical protein